MVVVLTGSNDFARTAELKKLVADFLREHDEMAIERFDGEESTAERMQAAIQSLPFLTARKLVILREPGKQKTWAEKFDDILAQIADTTDLVIVEPKLDKRLSYYKILKKKADFRDFTDLDAFGLAQWAKTYVKEQGGTLQASDAKFLVDRLGASQQLLQSELGKLLVYDPVITKTTIELLVEPLPQSTVFELLDAAFQGKTEQTFVLYREQRALKVEPQAIIAMLAWQLHVLAVVKAAGDRSPEDIAKTAKLNPFVVRKTLGLARNLSLAKVKVMVADLLMLDVKLKSVTMDADEALQLYLLKIAV